jgi:ABC-2 type transport system ATP-binding protein
MERDDVIQVEHLRKTYGSLVAVDDVSFSVGRGEIFGLLGRNGAGKTTSVECIQGLRHPDGGSVRVLGLDPQRQTTELRRRIGCQLQESALPDRLRVWEALDLFSSLIPEGTAGRAVGGAAGSTRQGAGWRPLLDQWGLSGKEKASFVSLSGGQRQRLLVALALVNDPEVVFLDEMTTGLDPAARRVAWDLIRAVRERGTTVVLVTHFMDEAEQLCDRLAVVDAGRVVALDSPQGLISTYARAVRVRFGSDLTDLEWLRDVPHVEDVRRHGGQVEIEGNGPVLALVAASLVERGIVPSDLRVEQPGLEEVFLSITGGGEEGLGGGSALPPGMGSGGRAAAS